MSRPNWKKQWRKKDASTFFRCYYSAPEDRYHCFYPQKGARPCRDLDLSTEAGQKKCDFRKVVDEKRSGRAKNTPRYDARRSYAVFNDATVSQVKFHLNKARQRYATALALLAKYSPFQLEQNSQIERWSLYQFGPTRVNSERARLEGTFSRDGSSKGLPKVVAFHEEPGRGYEPVDKRLGVEKEGYLTRPLTEPVPKWKFTGSNASKKEAMYGRARAYRRSALRELWKAMMVTANKVCRQSLTMAVNEPKERGDDRTYQPSDVLSEADMKAMAWMVEIWPNPFQGSKTNRWKGRFREGVLVLNKLIPPNSKMGPMVAGTANPNRWISGPLSYAQFLEKTCQYFPLAPEEEEEARQLEELAAFDFEEPMPIKTPPPRSKSPSDQDIRGGPTESDITEWLQSLE